MAKYDFKTIEKKWQQSWEDGEVYKTSYTSKKKKFYGLVEFPYPSGAGLHVGHPRPYTAMDVITRKKRMEGFEVLFPIGFDAFGLPTENYAIKTGRPPAEVTQENIENFTRQIKSLGFGFDWSRAVDTTDPDYYKWTQWLFLKFYEHDLAYKKNMPINWCLDCKIGLANEEVVDGKCERCGGQVEKRDKEQWMLAITKYADSLLGGLEKVDYITPAKVQQQNWIGKKEGVVITHDLKDMDGTIETFSAYPAWLYADTYIVVAPEHPFVDGISKNKEVRAFLKEMAETPEHQRVVDKEKKGVFTGHYAVDPFSGEDMPIWIANFALMHFGTGAIRCSSHDQRDVEFAQKYDLKLKHVVGDGEFVDAHPNTGTLKNSGDFTGRDIDEKLIEEMVAWMEKQGFAKRKTTYRLRDWVFSRQRYWGEPIPLIWCDACDKWVSVPEDQLPVLLPEVKKYEPTDTGESPLAAIKNWVNTECPSCGGPGRRETDTMPNWAGSSWYFLRYTDPHNKKEFASKKALKKWMEVDWYNGGMEHTVLHLLYSRFWNQFLYNIKLLPTLEPYKKRTSHGMILAKGGEKMSKSKGNVVNPDEIVQEYGADVFRTYEMFMGPFDQAAEWDDKGLVGVHRFLNKVWDLKIIDGKDSDDVIRKLHQTIKKVTNDIEKMHFNTAISSMMEFVNLTQKQGLSKDSYSMLIRILSPFAPHMCEELWEKLGYKKSVVLSDWPKFDVMKALEDSIALPVQVNGKLRAVLTVDAGITEKDAKELALETENVKKWLDGKKPSKIVFVKGKLISIVVK